MKDCPRQLFDSLTLLFFYFIEAPNASMSASVASDFTLYNLMPCALCAFCKSINKCFRVPLWMRTSIQYYDLPTFPPSLYSDFLFIRFLFSYIVLSARRNTSSTDSPSSCRAYPIAALIPPPDCTIFRLTSSASSPI